MLNVFPDFLTYSFFAPLLLRLALGAFIILRAHKALKATTPLDAVSKIITILFLISGAMIFIGLYTQVAVLVIILLMVAIILRKENPPQIFAPTETWLAVFVFAMALSLMLSGAGFYAIDLPL